MRVRAAHEAGVQHARQLDVVDIAAVPAQQPLELDPRNAGADPGVLCEMLMDYDLSARAFAAITAATASTMA